MKNESQIASLTRKLNLGSHASHGVKAVLGKMPINMSDSRADAVLSELRKRYAATDSGQDEGQAEESANQPWIEDAPMCPAYAAANRKFRR